MDISRHSLIVAAMLVVAVFAIAFFVYREYRSPTGFYAREHAAIRAVAEENGASPYTDLDGNPVRFDDFQGKPLVVNVWASWSPYSTTELPLLSKFASEYGDSVTIVALNRKEPKTTARAYLESIGTPTNITYIIDETDHFYRTTGGFAMPETVVYDAVGNITYHMRGVLTESDLRGEIERVLGD